MESTPAKSGSLFALHIHRLSSISIDSMTASKFSSSFACTVVAYEIGNNHFGPRLRIFGVMERVLNYLASLACMYSFSVTEGRGDEGLFVHTPVLVLHFTCQATVAMDSIQATHTKKKLVDLRRDIVLHWTPQDMHGFCSELRF